MTTETIQIYKALFSKEWLRLKRNPAALMAVGLIILMAFLINIESKRTTAANSTEKSPCYVVYNNNDKLVQYLKQHQHPKLRVRFIQTDKKISAKQSFGYSNKVSCVVEVADLDLAKKQPIQRMIFRSDNSNPAKMNSLSRWTLSGVAAYYSNIKIEQGQFSILQQKATEAKVNSSPFDLGSSKSKAIVSAMLLFSAQFFICCALFISLTAHEKEHGIILALAMSPASASQIWKSKILFHLMLSIIASIIITGVLNIQLLVNIAFYILVFPIIVLASLGLLNVATIIVSLNQSQTSASLMGFCYLMFVGVVFSLAQHFAGFAMLKKIMFEHHVINLYTTLYDSGIANRTRQERLAEAFSYLGHSIILLIVISISTAVAYWVWSKKGWRSN